MTGYCQILPPSQNTATRKYLIAPSSQKSSGLTFPVAAGVQTTVSSANCWPLARVQWPPSSTPWGWTTWLTCPTTTSNSSTKSPHSRQCRPQSSLLIPCPLSLFILSVQMSLPHLSTSLVHYWSRCLYPISVPHQCTTKALLQNKQKYTNKLLMKRELRLNYPGSVRWQHLLAPYTDNIQKPVKSLDCLLDEVTQPGKSRWSDIKLTVCRLTTP